MSAAHRKAARGAAEKLLGIAGAFWFASERDKSALMGCATVGQRGIRSLCGNWMLVAAPGVPRSGFYGFTHDEILMSLGVLPRAQEIQDLLDSTAAALDAAEGLVWPERVYRACDRLWVYRVVDGFRMYVPVRKVRALATAAEMPNPRSNVKGVLRVIIPHSECNGTGVEIADLIPEPAEITPAAAGPRVYRFKLAPVEPKNWGE